ncbi:hypothetical protein DVM85_03550 [Escherichia coli]|nr:hypothetical protein [Escherichia coli]
MRCASPVLMPSASAGKKNMKNGGEAMNTITNEQLIEHAEAQISYLRAGLEIQDDVGASEMLRLMEIALASLEAEAAAGDYQPAIDILRDRAARELDGGFRAHHNALIYAANELENAQAFGQEVSHES